MAKRTLGARLTQWSAVLLVLALAPQAEAGIIKWTLSGVTFSDGGTASGSFLYDADTQTLSGFDVVTTAGSVLGGHTYLDVAGAFPPYPAAGFAVVDSADANLLGDAFFSLVFASSLNNAGGVLALLSSSGEGTCLTSSCSYGQYMRVVRSGSVVGYAVSEPGTLSLFAIGALGLLFARRRRAAN